MFCTILISLSIFSQMRSSSISVPLWTLSIRKLLPNPPLLSTDFSLDPYLVSTTQHTNSCSLSLLMMNSSPLHTMNLSICKLVLALMVSVFFFIQISATSGSDSTGSRNITQFSMAGLKPLMPKEYQLFTGSLERRRRLEPFQLCLSCKCCAPGGDPTTCTSMPCCYGIDCEIPNKPFGVCAFVPKTCNCTSCAV